MLYKTLEVGRQRMGVPDLLPMVPIQWLGIACVHVLSLTTVSVTLEFRGGKPGRDSHVC
jgi:hypothetical protein